MSGTNGIFKDAYGNVGNYIGGRLIAVLLSHAIDDRRLQKFSNLEDLLSHSGNVEVNSASYSRQEIMNASIVPLENFEMEIHISDITWTSLSTPTPITKLLICYAKDHNTPDREIIPLTYHTFDVYPDGHDITALMGNGAFYRGRYEEWELKQSVLFYS